MNYTETLDLFASLPKRLSAHDVIPWGYDFNFFISKSEREILRIYTEGVENVLANIMNFSVTVDACIDYLWHSQFKSAKTEFKDEREFKIELCKSRVIVGLFVDISNTYKHSDRHKANHLARNIQVEVHTKEWLEDVNEYEKSNAIVLSLINNETGKEALQVFCPIIWLKYDGGDLRIPLRVAVEVSVKVLCEYQQKLG